MNIVEVRNLSVVRGGVQRLSVPELTLHKGEILSLIGPNGAGKTTLLQALGALIRISGGAIFFYGEEVDAGISLTDYRRKITMVFQDPLLFDSTVYKNVATGLRFRHEPRKQIESIVMENLRLFGIEHLRDRSARKISGGEGQRTALARAFATNPEVLLLDEPFSALDPPSRESLIVDLEKVLRRFGTTTVFATHDRMEAVRLSDRIAVMSNGALHQIGTTEEIMNRPASELVASFVGTETILRGTVVEERDGILVVAVGGQNIYAAGVSWSGSKATLCIRPENVILSRNQTEKPTNALNVFHGRIVRITPLGIYRKVEIDCGFPLVSYVVNETRAPLDLGEGTDVVASFKTIAVHVISGS